MDCAALLPTVFSLQDVDWDTQEGHYRVRIQGEWIVVPDAAVVTDTQIRCFIPGAGT